MPSQRSARSRSAHPRLWSVLGLVFIVLTHHQAAAQATAPQGASAASVMSASNAAPAAATPTDTAKAGGDEAVMWKTVSDSLAKVLGETLGQRPVNSNAVDMIQSATDFLKGLGTGKNLQNMGDRLNSAASNLGGRGTLRAITDNDLLGAFDRLRDNAMGMGMALSSNSPMLDVWTRMADALQGAGGRAGDLTAILPALMGRGGTGTASSDMAQATTETSQGVAGMGFVPTLSDLRGIGNTLRSLGLDAFNNGPGGVVGLVSLGLGLASAICGTVGGALFVAGISVILGASIESLETRNLEKYQDNDVISKLSGLAVEANTLLLPAALNPWNIQLVEVAAEVLERTIAIAGARQQ